MFSLFLSLYECGCSAQCLAEKFPVEIVSSAQDLFSEFEYRNQRLLRLVEYGLLLVCNSSRFEFVCFALEQFPINNLECKWCRSLIAIRRRNFKASWLRSTQMFDNLQQCCSSASMKLNENLSGTQSVSGRSSASEGITANKQLRQWFHWFSISFCISFGFCIVFGTLRQEA